MKAKQLLLIPHRWVTDAVAGTGEGMYDLCDNLHDAVRVDSADLLYHLSMWTNPTSASLSSSVTGKGEKLYMHAFTVNFASFYTLT